MPAPTIHLRPKREPRRSKKGSSVHSSPAPPKAASPTSSPSRNQSFAGISFSVWNMNRKYHSGLMPAGAGAKASAFSPSSQGARAASAPSTPSATYQAIISRRKKLGKKDMSRRAGGSAFHSASIAGG